jgi:hypothetical protein
MFANANKLEKLYTDVLARFKKYISTNLLYKTNMYDEDILHFFLKNKEYASTISNMKEQDKINVNVEIRSCPLLPTKKHCVFLEDFRSRSTRVQPKCGGGW